MVGVADAVVVGALIVGERLPAVWVADGDRVSPEAVAEGVSVPRLLVAVRVPRLLVPVASAVSVRVRSRVAERIPSVGTIMTEKTLSSYRLQAVAVVVRIVPSRTLTSSRSCRDAARYGLTSVVTPEMPRQSTSRRRWHSKLVTPGVEKLPKDTSSHAVVSALPHNRGS